MITLHSRCAIILIAIVIAAPAVADDAADAAKWRKAFDDVYGRLVAEAAKSKGKEDDSAIARQLQQAVATLDVPPGLLIVIAEKTVELVGSETFDHNIAIEALLALAQRVPAEKAACERKITMVLDRAFASAEVMQAAALIGKALIPRLLIRADESLAAGLPEVAVPDLERALVVAAVAIPAQTASIAARLRDARARVETNKEMGQLKLRLRADRRDQAARARLVQILLFERDDPRAAFDFIGEGLDEATLRYLPFAATDGARATQAELFETAQWYKRLAAGALGPTRTNMLTRAHRFFTLFLESKDRDKIDELTRAKAALLREQVDVALAAQKAADAGLRLALDGDPLIDQAIDRLREYLYAKQKPDGSWDYLYENPHAGKRGFTAFVTLALLESGVPAHEPHVAKALTLLKEPEEWVYATSLQIRVWSLVPADQRKPLIPLVDRLSQKGGWPGVYSYQTPRDPLAGREKPPHDHSNTAYALAALGYAHQADAGVVPEFWQRVAEHFIEAQQNDGGWNYRIGDERPSYITMTADCLIALSLAAEHGQIRRMTPADKAYAAGLRWLHANANAEIASPSWGLYGLDSLSRLAHMRGLTYIGGRRWRDRAVAHIGRNMAQAKDGSAGWIVDTPFALMFLSQTRLPRWCARIELPDEEPRAAADPVYLFTQKLQSAHRGRLAWQRLSLDEPLEYWTPTPVAYLAAPNAAAIKLSDAQKLKLKRYLDAGGMLIASGDKLTRDAIERLALELFPDLKFAALDPRHPLDLMYHRDAIAKSLRAPRGLGEASQRSIRVLMRDDRILIFNPPVNLETVFAKGDEKDADTRLMMNAVIWHISKSPVEAMYRWKAEP